MTELNDSFWKRVDKTDACWNWIGSKINDGYGRIRFKTKKVLVHRLMWISKFGEIPNGMCVCHKCDNPACVNPDHLFLGTHQQNMDGKNRKGRQSRTKGERNGSSKLTKEEVTEIRNLYSKGKNQKSKLSLHGLAEKYNVSFSTIHKIVKNRTWSD